MRPCGACPLSFRLRARARGTVHRHADNSLIAAHFSGVVDGPLFSFRKSRDVAPLRTPHIRVNRRVPCPWPKKIHSSDGVQTCLPRTVPSRTVQGFHPPLGWWRAIGISHVEARLCFPCRDSVFSRVTEIPGRGLPSPTRSLVYLRITSRPCKPGRVIRSTREMRSIRIVTSAGLLAGTNARQHPESCLELAKMTNRLPAAG